MLSVRALGSGSKGNAVLITNATTRVLVDCGLPIKELTKRLLKVQVTLSELDGVVITHEHDDHIKSIMELSEGYRVPVYLHRQVHSLLKSKLHLSATTPFDTLESFPVGNIEIAPFRTSHDAVYPVGYTLTDTDSKVLYATDLGFVPPRILDEAKEANVVFLESNHDLHMLKNGRYPAFLKQRILSDRGHLSNEDCARAILEMCSWGPKKFILGHLSEENNLPEIAYWETVHGLESKGGKQNRDFSVHVASQREILEEIKCEFESTFIA